MIDNYQAGYDAYNAGKTRSDCPFLETEELEDYRKWSNGFIRAKSDNLDNYDMDEPEVCLEQIVVGKYYIAKTSAIVYDHEQYLHSDGVWRCSTIPLESGYFDTREEAEQCLSNKLHREKPKSTE